MHHTTLKNCLEAFRLLDDYLSRELTPELEERLDEHLRICQECARRFGFERWLAEYIRDRLRQGRAPAHLRAWLNRMLGEGG
ncbi:MAG: zf-HC2 domain-containing protein [Armatimonadetes bacterium]|nr:zf-HC2 domain-containing protein [Armatimonadota bacterium]